MNRSRLANKFIEEDTELRRKFIGAAMEHRAGQKFLWWLLEIGRAVGQQPFTGEALSTAFNCGGQNVGNQILAEIIEAVDDGLATLMQNAQREEKERRAALADLKEEE